VFKQLFEQLSPPQRRCGLLIAAQANVRQMREVGMPLEDEEFFRTAYEAGVVCKGVLCDESR
jgi:hypothetical protein